LYRNLGLNMDQTGKLDSRLMPIRLLPEEIASRIAAGEVVERPASVVKELMENSLDADATRIEIETEEGGKGRIRVRDNGVGIPSDEVVMAFRRHATSKLETTDDLEKITTLGFRGEALSSIASVSRLTCTTRHRDEPTGTHIRLEGGQVVSQRTAGRPPGTEILIEDLFYNVPARRKFLRTERTERRHIDSFLTRYAIAYPGVAFQVHHDGREVLLTSGNNRAKEVLINVYGMELGGNLLEIPTSLSEGRTIRVRGFVGPPTVHRANRGYITIFVNGRWIENTVRLNYAVIQAYHTLLPVKRYPVAFVLIDLPLEDVDVNVHPTKAEVRFRDGDAVFRAVQRAVRATVIQESPSAASFERASPGTDAESHPNAESRPDPQGDTQRNRARLRQIQPREQQFRLPEQPMAIGSMDEDTPGSSAESRVGSQLPPLRILGQAATMFIIAEGPDGLYLIDQHAAHERVLYERMMSETIRRQVATQTLLEPATLSLPPDAATHLEEMLETIRELGIDVEPFGPNTFRVRALPAYLTSLSPDDLLADIATSLESNTVVDEELEESLVRTICKRAAVKAGQVLAPEEMKQLIRDLEQTVNPRTCPHGRPTIIQISTETLARQFGRI
jgi:DNA mismatch repair protein MutL